MKEILLTDGMRSRAVVNTGNPYRILKAFEKAARGEEITYVALGGSITQRYNASEAELCFAARVADWWKKTFPNAKINYVNAGIGATGSLIGLHRLKRDVLNYNPDFVITEFAVNEGTCAHTTECYDNLMYNILNYPTKPAVLCLCMLNHTGGCAQESHIQAARHYDLPMISYHDVVWEEMQAGRLQWNDVSNDLVHPNDPGHKLTADLITEYLESLVGKSSCDYADTDCSVPLVSNRYLNAEMYYIDDITPKDDGCFVREKVNLNKIPYGWCARENGAPMVFELENCKSIHILFERTNGGDGGKVSVNANGRITVLDADFKDGWGIYANHTCVFQSDTPTDVTLTITPQLEDGKHFSLAGIMKA